MPMEDFNRLIEGICELKNLQRPQRADDACQMSVNGVGVTVLPCGTSGDVDSAIFVIDYGALPEGPRAEWLQFLMETNLYLLGPNAPRFGCNPENGHVLYMGHVPLAGVTPQAFQSLLDEAAEQAQLWQVRVFQESPGADRSFQPRPGTASQLRRSS